MTGTWQQILASYPPEKRDWDRTFPWIYYGARPLSFPLTWIALWCRLTPNQVTLLSFVAGMGGLLLMTRGGAGLVVGTCLFALLNILDCVDGNLARMRRENSPPGKFFDAAVGLIFYLVYFALGLGLYRTPDSSLSLLLAPLGVERPLPVAYVVLGTVATLSRYLGLQLQHLFHGVLGSYWETKKAEQNMPPPTTSRYYRVYQNTTDVQGQDPILIGATVTGLASLYLALSAAIQVLNLAGLAALYIRRARALGQDSR